MVYKKKYIIMILLILTSALSAETPARVDWIEGKVKSSGSSSMAIDEHGTPVDMETGKHLSISEARNISYERAREKSLIEAVRLINEIQVDSEKRIKDLVLQDVTVRESLTKVIEEYSRFREKPSGYLTSSCELELNLGYLLTALNYSFPGDEFPVRNNDELSTLYTSLIIDVRGLGIKPMLLPAVLNESGLEVFNRNFIRPSDAVKYNPVSYVYSEKNAVSHKKAGKHPFFCAALKNMNGNPVVSDDDLKKIFSNKKNIEYLSKCRVIFIIDR